MSLKQNDEYHEQMREIEEEAQADRQQIEGDERAWWELGPESDEWKRHQEYRKELRRANNQRRKLWT